VRWFSRKRLQEPWDNNFSILLVPIDDPANSTEPHYTIPYNHHVQLISAQISLTPGVLPPTMHCFLRASRGDQTLYRPRVNLSNAALPTGRTSGGVSLLGFQDRNSAHWGTFKLPDYMYLYPEDLLTFGMTLQGPGTWQLHDISFTFKLWLTA
jgi:hypothetical protein